MTKEQMAKENFAKGYHYVGDWNGYKVYRFDYVDEGEIVLGQLHFMLEKGSVLRLSTDEETSLIMQKFYSDDE